VWVKGLGLEPIKDTEGRGGGSRRRKKKDRGEKGPKREMSRNNLISMKEHVCRGEKGVCSVRKAGGKKKCHGDEKKHTTLRETEANSTGAGRRSFFFSIGGRVEISKKEINREREGGRDAIR